MRSTVLPNTQNKNKSKDPFMIQMGSFVKEFCTPKDDDCHANRIVSKMGKVKVVKDRIYRKRASYLNDFFHTLTHISWIKLLVFYCSCYLLSWTFFATILYAIEPKENEKSYCVTKLKTFWDAFLYSLQTQATIGYGNYTPDPEIECIGTIITIGVQSIAGLVLDSFLCGLLFFKLITPRNRASSVIFTPHAVITRRNGKNYFAFRIADLQKERIVEGRVSVYLFYKHQTKEGEILDFEPYRLLVTPSDSIPLLLPQIMTHEINERSPLNTINQNEFMQKRIEIIVTYEGYSPTSGLPVQARHSYLNEDIIWYHSFKKMIVEKDSNFNADWDAFDTLIPQNIV
eukprot:c18563_g1_i2.p1 GENE.c18563_g1_i2~~c18563_g1_i2.p1  ORF type:complete len:343 (-),score=106.36 c18563_g1_i2:3-1031(-)